MVFQNIALYPHMTVRENIGYGLKIDGVSKQERNSKIEEAAELLQIKDQLDKKPSELSGGQQQRVALGSVFVEQPEILLLDEPMSDLDAKLKAELRVELQRLHQRLDVTTVYVTHDQTEAMTMSDHVALLNMGQIEQFAPPKEMFSRPTSEYAATFMGTPSTNVLNCELVNQKGEVTVKGPGMSFSLPERQLPLEHGDTIKIGIRPQYLSPQAGQHTIDVTVEVIEPLGTESVIHAKTPDDQPFDIVTDSVRNLEPDDQIKVGFDLEDVFIFGNSGEAISFGDELTPTGQTTEG